MDSYLTYNCKNDFFIIIIFYWRNKWNEISYYCQPIIIEIVSKILVHHLESNLSWISFGLDRVQSIQIGLSLILKPDGVDLRLKSSCENSMNLTERHLEVEIAGIDQNTHCSVQELVIIY
ncbi:unnamed protein product [Rhizophagus irregularis]|nr:unnamed protein product [Rhizophagus irregularis]